MNIKILTIIILGLFSNQIISQTVDLVNPKGNWYFGAEIGRNTASSLSLGENQNSFQGGVLGEYYFAKQWSLSGRIKYFKTGVSFNQPGSGGWFGSPGGYGVFNGAVIAVPINIKWEFRIYKNLKGYLKLGYVHNIETKSEYGNYSNNSTDYSKYYGAVNGGYGLNYFINEKMAVYIDFEGYSGASKGETQTILGTQSHNVQNRLLNFGFKYNFKNGN
jgi:hypothetical protein